MQYNEINKLTILIDKVTHTLHHVIKLAVSEQKLKHRYFSPLSSQYENVGHWAMLVQNIPLGPLASPRKKIWYRKKYRSQSRKILVPKKKVSESVSFRFWVSSHTVLLAFPQKSLPSFPQLVPACSQVQPGAAKYSTETWGIVELN